MNEHEKALRLNEKLQEEAKTLKAELKEVSQFQLLLE